MQKLFEQRVRFFPSSKMMIKYKLYLTTQKRMLSQRHKYTRYDLCIKRPSQENLDSLADELALLIARLRLSSQEYLEWLKYWDTGEPIPPSQKQRYRDAFSYSFVSEIDEEHKEHLKYVPYSKVASMLYCKLKEQGTLNLKQVKLPHINANHELDV